MTAADEPKPTLLIVEDERSNLASLDRIFQREGYRTLSAEDARAGLEICRKQRVHVVLTDLMLPGMSGIDLIKALHTVAPDAAYAAYRGRPPSPEALLRKRGLVEA